jgi:hypothetical protein
MLTLARLWLSLADTTVWIGRPGDGADGALVVRHERDVAGARAPPDPRHDLLGVPHLRHDLRVNERRHLDARQPRLGQPVDDLDLRLGRDPLRLDLEAVARPDLADGHARR